MAQFFTVTGNQVSVYINGQLINVLATLRATQDFAYEPVPEVGNIDYREYVPTVARYAITISKALMTLENAINAGIWTSNGAAALQGLTFDIEIFSNQGPLLRKFTQCVNASADMSIQANRLIIVDMNFLAIDVTGNLSSVQTS
jgi:hypothetical protein